MYRDSKGKEPVTEYLQELLGDNGKDSKIKANKIRTYIKILQERGTRAGKPYVDHIEGDIWELRPIRDRILFAAWDGDAFVLLHVFMKKTQKTPKREINKAKREFEDFKESMKNERI